MGRCRGDFIVSGSFKDQWICGKSEEKSKELPREKQHQLRPKDIWLGHQWVACKRYLWGLSSRSLGGVWCNRRLEESYREKSRTEVDRF